MFKNMRLGIKQGLSFGILIFFTATVGLTGWISLWQVERMVRAADDQNRLIKYAFEVRGQEKEYLLHGEQKYVEAVLELLSKIKTQIDNTGATLKEDKGISEIVAKYKKAFEEFVNLSNQQEAKKEIMVQDARKFIQMCEELRQEAIEVVQVSKNNNELRENIKVADDQNRLIKYAFEVRGQEKEYLLHGEQKYVEAVLELLSKIKTQIDNTGATLEEDKGISEIVAEYKKAFEEFVNLSNQQEAKKEIMVQDARKFIQTCEELRQEAIATMNTTMDLSRIIMIILTIASVLIASLLAFLITRDLTGGVQTLASSSSQISATSTQLAASASEISASVSEITTTVEEVRQTAQVSDEKAKHVLEEAEKVARISELGRNATEDAIAGMNRIKEEMEKVAESIVKLSEQTQSIGEIINAVNDLADQSNLLSVNASIEAAKAGEHGKGFAVVAQEVKSLAEQSKEATNQVKTILNDIQKATSAAVMATERGSKAVEAGMDLSAQSGDAIGTLADNITESAQASTQIAASSQQQLIGMDQLVQAMESIKDASMQNMDSAKQLESASRNLEDLGQRLK